LAAGSQCNKEKNHQNEFHLKNFLETKAMNKYYNTELFLTLVEYSLH
jgi:hypothetical protein